MKFRRKDPIVNAAQWTGDNFEELRALVGDHQIAGASDLSTWIRPHMRPELDLAFWDEADETWRALRPQEYLLIDKEQVERFTKQEFEELFEPVPAELVPVESLPLFADGE